MHYRHDQAGYSPRRATSFFASPKKEARKGDPDDRAPLKRGRRHGALNGELNGNVNSNDHFKSNGNANSPCHPAGLSSELPGMTVPAARRH